MDTFDTEVFITEVEKRPSLWDSSSVEYSNRDLKKQCWEEIVNIFGGKKVSVLEKKDLANSIQKKWKSIRGCYTREVCRKKQLKSGSAAAFRKSEYIYFRQLKFLQKVVAVREFEPVTNTGEDSQIIDIDGTLKRTMEHSDDRNDRTAKRTKLKKKKAAPQADQFVKVLSESEQKYELSQEDDDKLFLLSLLGTLKQVPQHKKMVVKIKIMSILDEATQSSPYQIIRSLHDYNSEGYSHDHTLSEYSGSHRAGYSSNRVASDVSPECSYHSD